MEYLELTTIRLLTNNDVNDANKLAHSFYSYNQEIEQTEFLNEIVILTILELIYKGYADFEDVIKTIQQIAETGYNVKTFTSINKSATAQMLLKKFNPTGREFWQLKSAIPQLKIALKNYNTACAVAQSTQSQEAQTDHQHPTFKKILQLAAARKNVLLVGPAGTGKTHAARQVAEHLGLEFASVSVTAGMSVSQLTGWLMPTGYLESDFVRLYENGGVFLLDEMDAADANTLTVMNQAIANGSFNVAQRTGHSEIKKHKDFVCIAAANTFGTGGDMIYAGREQLDAATLDRFMTVYFDYDKQFETKRCNPEILKFTHSVRTAINTLKLRRVMSTRKALDFTDMVQGEAKWSLQDCKACYFTGWSADEIAKITAHI